MYLSSEPIKVFYAPGSKTPATLYLSPNSFLYLLRFPFAHTYI